MTRSHAPILVAIVGGSGSGKTWLADRLRAALRGKAGRLSLDDFYRDRSHLSAARRAKLNFDHPRAIDWPKLERVLQRCAAGKPARIPSYDFTKHCRRPGSKILKPKPIVLVDGLWLLRRRSLRRLFKLRIFLDSPAATRLRRRLLRDSRSRGRTRASVQEQFRKTVQPMHLKYVAPQARWADVLLSQKCGRREVRQLLLIRLFQQATTGSVVGCLDRRFQRLCVSSRRSSRVRKAAKSI